MGRGGAEGDLPQRRAGVLVNPRVLDFLLHNEVRYQPQLLPKANTQREKLSEQVKQASSEKRIKQAHLPHVALAAALGLLQGLVVTLVRVNDALQQCAAKARGRVREGRMKRPGS
jgi:hypothetical protein